MDAIKDSKVVKSSKGNLPNKVPIPAKKDKTVTINKPVKAKNM